MSFFQSCLSVQRNMFYFIEKYRLMKWKAILIAFSACLSLVACSKEDESPKGSNTKQATYNRGYGNSNTGLTLVNTLGGKPMNHSPSPPPSHNGVSANCNSCHKGMLIDAELGKLILDDRSILLKNSAKTTQMEE